MKVVHLCENNFPFPVCTDSATVLMPRNTIDFLIDWENQRKGSFPHFIFPTSCTLKLTAALGVREGTGWPEGDLSLTVACDWTDSMWESRTSKLFFPGWSHSGNEPGL